MNQHADSLKINLSRIPAMSRFFQKFFQKRAFESHHALHKPANLNRAAHQPSLRALRSLPLFPFSLEPAQHLRNRLLEKRHILRDQNESERQHPQPEDGKKAEDASKDQHERQRNSDVAR
jgi:hypothetical protein